MQIIPLPAFTDNYIWMVVQNNHAVVVDPGDAMPVFGYCQHHHIVIDAILITHHHHDHIGGVQEIRKSFNCNVIAPRYEALPMIADRTVSESDMWSWNSHHITVIDTPGHTAGHICYVFDLHTVSPSLFCGDTLFSAGCGRLLGGSAAQLERSLLKLSKLPEETLVYCTHEYTQSNVNFARKVDPNNEALISYQEYVKQLRQRNASTLPSTIGLEKAINPFLRTHYSTIEQAVIAHDSKLANKIGVFAALRTWKNET